jgi:kynurenine formamidase
LICFFFLPPPLQFSRYKQDKAACVGVKADNDTIKWFWDHHFAAVGGDTVSFESWPPAGSIMLHEYFLAFWGTPIGEMFNLEGLAELCKKHNRWSFFFTSAPLNVPGGVASPPSAVAVF